MAKEEDMLVIFRPGPYICGEWEFGGLPSWLLHQQPMFFRSSFAPYEERAEIFLEKILDQVRDFQFYTEEGARGGPIIMTQIENEFGNFGYSDYPRDKEHLRFIKKVLIDGGIESLLFTSDTPTLTGDWGNVDYELMTANFKWKSEKELLRIKELRPNAPILVSEFWPGWFDHWFDEMHNVLSEADFREILGNIFNAEGSVNFYMFHGGTNFGFMNGGNILGFSGLEVPPVYVPDVTSYDYDAPLSESGQYTDKYYATRDMIAAYDPLYSLIDTIEPPVVEPHFAYEQIEMLETLSFTDILSGIDSSKISTYQKPRSMEELEINDGNGQDYGYIVYRKSLELTGGSVLKIRGHVRDLVQVMINGEMVSEPILSAINLLTTFGSWAIRDSEFVIPQGVSGVVSLELLAENLGRANFGVPHTFNQKKGIWEGDILIDNEVVDDWEHVPLEMTGDLIKSFKSWKPIDRSRLAGLPLGPKLLRGVLTVQEPRDTFFDYSCQDCQDWKHGALWVNGFNVGRYFQAGPQKTLYIPGPLLKPGDNDITVFENYMGSTTLKFTDTPNLGTPLQSDQF